MKFLTNQGHIQRIKDLLHTQLPDYATAQIRYRGTYLPLDPILSGYVRFGRRLGSTVSLLFADSWTRLTSEAVQNSGSFEVRDIPLWVDSGVLVNVGMQSVHEVDLVDQEDLSVTISDTLPATFAVDSAVVFYAYPISLNGAVPLPDPTHLSVMSPWKIFIGDMLGIEGTKDFVNSITEYEVLVVTETAFDGTNYTYDITMDHDVPRAMEDDERLYLICNPGYESGVINIPTSPAFYYQLIGPFLVDWFSGELLDTVYAEEVFALETYRGGSCSGGTPIMEMQRVAKNYAVLYEPIEGHFPLFWECSRGTLKYSPGYTHLISEMVDKEESIIADLQVYDVTGAVTGVANTYYVEVAETPDTIASVKQDGVNVPYTQVSADSVYLRSNADITGVASQHLIAGVTATYPTTISTVTDHGMTTGDVVTITGNVGSTPNINSTYTATVAGAKTFTIPVSVTVAGAGGFITTNNVAVVTVNAKHTLETGDLVSVYDNNSTPNIQGTHVTLRTLDDYRFVIAATVTVGSATGKIRRLVDTVVGYNYSSGKAFLWTDLVPTWTGDANWVLRLVSDSDGLFRIRFYPNDWQDVYLTAGTPASMPIHIVPPIGIFVSTVASPTVIETMLAHGLSTGEEVTVAGHVGATPTINGTYTATVIDATHFSIPVAVTVAGVGGTVHGTGSPATRIELIWAGDPSSTVKLGTWGTYGTRVRQLKYTMVARPEGGDQWVGSGILLKPIFLSIDEIRARVDRDHLSRGAVVL